MNCIKCNTDIPTQRLEALPNTKVCVACSDEESVACVDIVYHKTGNTIQIMSQSQAAAINKSSKRSGFGSLRALKGGSGGGNTKATKLGGTYRMPRTYTQEDLNKVLQEALEMIDLGYDHTAVHAKIQSALDARRISGLQFRRINEIIEVLHPAPVEEVEVTEEHNEVDPEITRAFRNWKNSKIYR